MEVARLSEVKDGLSRFVAMVRRGGRVRILVRGVPAADLVPVEDGRESPSNPDPSLAALERAGVIRRGRGGIPPEILRPGPRPRGRPLSRMIVEERRSGR